MFGNTQKRIAVLYDDCKAQYVSIGPQINNCYT